MERLQETRKTGYCMNRKRLLGPTEEGMISSAFRNAFKYC